MLDLKFGTRQILVFLGLLLSAPALFAQGPVILTADGQTDAYTLITNKLGAGPETPDCSHPAFGPHITQAFDNALARNVFVFHIHVTPDNDRCINFDRQRLEIKTDGASPAYLKAALGETVNYTWKFKLDAAFQPESHFTHIHQIKAGDGDAGAPLITITPRSGTPNILQIIQSTGSSPGVNLGTLTTTPLAPFLGVWVEAYEKITFGSSAFSSTGSYSLTLKRVSDGAVLLSYSNNNIDLWRTGTTFCRPKWGIYRSLLDMAALRDEDVLFGNYCLAKGADDCQTDFTITAQPGTQTAIAGNNAAYTITIAPINVFAGNVALSVSGLPPGATAGFNPTTVNAGSGTSTLTISNLTAVGSYPLTITGAYANLNHSTPATLVVQANTSTAVSSSVNPSVTGQLVIFTATVSITAPGSGTPTGTVQFKDGANNLGAQAALNSGTATLITSSLTQGIHNITATYNGDANFLGSTSPPLTQTVNQALQATSTALNSNPNPSTAGQSVTFTASVTPASASGTVQFNDGTTSLCSLPLNSGTAVCTANSLAIGTHNITASYSGDSNFLPSVSPVLTQTVTMGGGGTPTTTQLAAPAAIYFHQNVPAIFTATVTASGTPTGSVVLLLDGNKQLGNTLTLANGIATFMLPLNTPPWDTALLHPGIHSLKAIYLGDSNFSQSTSSALTIEVSPRPKPR